MRITLLSLLLLLAFALAGAAENQAFLGIFAETSVQKMVGMPDMSAMMGNLPPGMVLPGMPQRNLTVRLWSPSIAPKDAFARLAVPAGLKQGKQLNLDLYRPTEVKGKGGNADTGMPDPEQVKDFTIIRYWGSSPTVKPGQPEIIKFAAMAAADKETVRDQARRTQSEYYYKPDWTTGYWPTAKQPGKITADVVLAGRYDLTTNYTGNVGIDVPETVRFLNPIEFASPNLAQQIDFSKPMVFKWKPIPGVLGYHAAIFAMKGKNTLITWNSSEIKGFESVSTDYMQMSDVLKYVKSTAMMAGDRIEVIVPAGIFNDCDMVMFTMIGYGTGAALAEGQPLPRVQTKTTVSIMLGGKGMAEMDMGNMGDEDEE